LTVHIINDEPVSIVIADVATEKSNPHEIASFFFQADTSAPHER